MELYIISVLLLVTPIFSYENFADVKNIETTTRNDLENSIPQFSEHMPATGCFKNIPENGEIAKVDSFESSTPNYPPQPLADSFAPNFPQYPPPPQFTRHQLPTARNPLFNSYYPRRPLMPFGPPFSPFQRNYFPQNNFNPTHPFVIVKLLQPIILPIARQFPEGDVQNPNLDVDQAKYTNFRGGLHRFVGGKYRALEGPMSYRQNIFGPHKIAEHGDNIQITLKLH